MTHTKFTISSIILCGLSNLIEQVMSFIIFPNQQISALFNGNLTHSPLLIAIFIKVLLSGLIGGILGFIFFPLFYRSEKLKVDFSTNLPTEQYESKNENTNDKSTKEQNSPDAAIDQQEAQPMTPLEAAKHLENVETKKEFEEKIGSGTFEDPNVVVENPGQTLVDNPATLFDPPPKELEKPQLDDESFGKKRYELGTPKP